jgi:EAL domain-containing protein (putative c-di-GMP-specific phosphodiesterase class I)
MGDGTFGSRLLIVDDEPSIGRPIKRVGKGSRRPCQDGALVASDGHYHQPEDAGYRRHPIAARPGRRQVRCAHRRGQRRRRQGLRSGAPARSGARPEDERRAPKPIRIEALGELLAALQITGVEALVRWRHPVHGLIRPAALWHGDNLALEVAIDISTRDLEDADLPERLQARCGEAGVDPAVITLEITETSAMREAMQMMDVLIRPRLKGFRLAIDDFGTGCSSLVQLQRMLFPELKIDRSFVAQIAGNQDCRTIVEILCDLARKLGSKSVAEGMETEAILEHLDDIGCDMAQGYFLSRPLTVEAVAAFVRQGRAPCAVFRSEAGKMMPPT